MERKTLLTLKILIYCLIIISIQTSFIGQFTSLNINLVFCSLIVFASILGFTENLIAVTLFTTFSAMLFYDGSIYWLYPVLSMIAYKLNPEQIPDKFLICVLYTIVFSALTEIFNPASTGYIDKVMEAVLINTATIVPLYFVTRSLLYKKPDYMAI